MANERITAWLRVRDKLRFIRDMRAAADAVDDLGDAEERAALKAALFSNEQRKAAINTRALKDHLSLTRGELMTTAITTSIYTAPALLALGNSAVAAALGGGAVAGGGLAALTVGLAGFAIVGAQAVTQLGKVTDAQDAYNMAIAQYGTGSKEAADASAKLWAVIQQNGGIEVWKLAQSLDALKTAWKDATAPARASFFSLMASGIQSARGLLPTFADETNKNAAVIRRDMSSLFTGISGPETKENIKVFSSIFRNMSPHLSSGIVKLFLVVGRVLRQAAPWAVTWSESFERTADAWERGTRDGVKLGATIDGLVGHTKAWWELAKALGNTLLILFRVSNMSGKGLVTSLTEVVRKFNAWLTVQEKTGKAAQFFDDFSDALREIARLLAPILVIVGTLAMGALPVLKDSSGEVNEALWIMARNAHILADALVFFGPLVGPIIKLWILWKVATIALDVVLGVLTFILAVLAGELWALALVVALIAAGFYLAYVKIGWFHDAVNATANFIRNNWITIVAAMFGPFGIGILYAIHHLEELKAMAISVGQAIVGWWRGAVDDFREFFAAIDKYGDATVMFLANRFRDLARLIGKVVEKANPLHYLKGAGGLIGKGLSVLPGFAGGGVIPYGTAGIVGEDGPELAQVGPSGTMISPLRGGGGGGGGFDPPSIGEGIFHFHLHTKVEMDRRTVAQANDEVKADKKARRGGGR